ncbi:MAG: cyclic nucleotide-binding domain-containing protein [Deltaproteobacteria bacterium]|nr:cyclic nucleotide-binding domain-containing protein [Deltaproteobacteria bacterium]
MWLRHIPWLADADLADLTLLAENLTELRHARGALVLPAGVRPPALHIVVEGELAAGAMTWAPHGIVGGVEVLARRPLRAAVIATRASRTLQLLSGDARELLEENIQLLRAALRALAGRVSEAPPPTVPSALGNPLGFVDRLLLLRDQSAYTGARLDALARLAHASREVQFPAGTPIVRAGEAARGSFVIVDGSAIGPQGELGPGHTIGALETLAEVPHPATITSRTPVRALETCAGTMFDVIEDHSDLGMAMLASFATTLAEGGTLAAQA